MIDSNQLTSTRLSSTSKCSRPLLEDTENHRPDRIGSVVHDGHRASSESDVSLPLPTEAPPSEGVWVGEDAAEHIFEKSAPSDPGDVAPEQIRSGTAGSRSAAHLGRWLALLVVGAAIPVLLALSGHRHQGTMPIARPRSVGSRVGMPGTLAGNVPIKPLRIALVVGGGEPSSSRAHEVDSFENWLARHSNPATRLTVIDAGGNRSTAALTPTAWASHPHGRSFVGTLADHLRKRLAAGRGRRVVITFAHSDPSTGRDLARLHLRPRRGAGLPKVVPLSSGQTTTKAVDPDEIQAFAATAARGVISISKMSEGDEE